MEQIHEVKLPNNKYLYLKHRNIFFDFILKPTSNITIGTTVYVSKKYLLTSLDIPTLIHEYTHSEQQNRYGILIWSLKYLLSKKFRLEQESESFARQIQATVGIENRISVLNQASSWLSGKKFWFCAKSFEIARISIKSQCSFKDFI